MNTQETGYPGPGPSWPLPTPSPTPQEEALRTAKFWATVLLVVTIGSILVFRYLLHTWRESSSDDDEWIESPTDLERGQSNPQAFVGQYRDDDGNAPSNSASFIQNQLNNLNASQSDNPYAAGVRVISSFNSPNHNSIPTPHAYNHQPLPAGFTNVKEIKRLVAQLNRIKDSSNPESDENSGRVKVIQQRITELVMADPRYGFASSSLLPHDPPPAYSDATN